MTTPKSDKKTTGTDVAELKNQNTALAVVEDFGDEAGAGFENVGRDEYKIPFLRILQALSPQCQDPGAGGLAGAKPGMIINTATNELYDGKKGLAFVPAFRTHNFVEFIHRDAGGGLVAIYPDDEPKVLQLQAKYGKYGKLPVGDAPPQGQKDLRNQISEVYSLYGIAVPDEAAAFRSVVAFSSSQIKKYQEYMTRSMAIKYLVDRGNGVKVAQNPPIYAHLWRLTTVLEKKGDKSWYNWQLRLHAVDENGVELPPIKSLLNRKTDDRYLAAADFHQIIKGGHAKVDYAAAQADVAEDPAQKGADEIPM